MIRSSPISCLWLGMYKLLERAKPYDVDLLYEIQNIDPAILVADCDGGRQLRFFASSMVNWLQVSPFFLSTKTQTIQSTSRPPHNL